MVLNEKPSQEYQVNAGVPRALFLVLHTLLLYINDLPDDAICDIYVNDATLYSKCDEASDQN